jgi:hypothetical protein
MVLVMVITIIITWVTMDKVRFGALVITPAYKCLQGDWTLYNFSTLLILGVMGAILVMILQAISDLIAESRKKELTIFKTKEGA